MLFDYDTDKGLMRAYGVFGRWDDQISETMMMEALDKMGGRDFTMHLQSEGGDVVVGLSIFNQFARYPGKIMVEVDAIAASIATVIMMAAEEVRATSLARVMIHRAWTIALGNAADFRRTADILESLDRDIAATYMAKAGGSEDDWFEMMQAETWYNAREAKDAGLIDEIIQVTDQQSSAAAKLQPIAACATNTVGYSPRVATLSIAAQRRKELVESGVWQ